MRDYLSWSVPGLLLAGPVQLALGPSFPWGAWLLIAPALGFVLQQAVRWRFESIDHGFRSPRRGALEVIIERGNLAGRADRGDLAYQVYEIVFYQRPEWEAIRGHAHRCWEWIFLFRGAAVGAVCGSGVALWAFVLGPHRPLASVLVATLAATAWALAQKAQQTEEALHLFDRALVEAHWERYEAVLERLIGETAAEPQPAALVGGDRR